MSRKNKILLSMVFGLCTCAMTMGACSMPHRADDQVMETSMETPESTTEEVKQETSNTVQSEPISEESTEESEIVEESTEDIEEPIVESVEEPESQVVIEEEPETQEVIEEEPYVETTPDWFMTLCAVVEAETHECNAAAKARIVHVIQNRIKSSEFPNDYFSVCNASGQFVQNWNIQQSTIDAVNAALNMSDTTGGALFFCTCSSGCYASGNREYLFTDDVGHHFWR